MDETVNGTLEIDAASGPVIYHNASSEPLNSGYNWKLYYQSGQWTNGPPAEPIYTDDVWAFGINMGGVGVPADKTKVYAAWHMESKFYENSSQSSPYVEYFLEIIDTMGRVSRPIGGVSSYDGTFDNVTLASSLLVFEDHLANPRVSFDFRAGNQCTVSDGLCFLFSQNNVPVARQENAAGTSGIALPYIDDASNMVVSAPITTPSADRVNASGPVVTSRGANTTALSAQAPGANAANILLSCQSGAAIRTGHMGIDANGNLVFSQDSTGGGLFFDFNGYIYFRNRANGYAQQIVVSPAAAQFNIPVKVPNYTVATAPSASSAGSGALIYVTNGDAGNPCLAVSDGTNWRRITFGTPVSIMAVSASYQFFSPPNSNTAGVPTASPPVSTRPSSTSPKLATGVIGTPQTADNLPFLPRFAISSTIASNGDLNPQGVAFVPDDFPAGGAIAPGDLLVSNFNSRMDLKGTGKTICAIAASAPVGTSVAKAFFLSRTQVGLTAALGVLRGGFVLVGNVPTSDGRAGTISQGSLQIIDRFGNLVGTLTDSIFLDSPWGMTINDRGNKAQVFVSNVLSGTVSRLDLTVGTSNVTVVRKATIAMGYGHRFDPTALVLGPTGLAYDAAADVLYVASTVDNTIFSVPQAGGVASFVVRGNPLYSDSEHLSGPSGLTIAPNGNLLTANGDAVNADPTRPSRIIEFTTSGVFVGESNIDVNSYAAFGVATVISGNPWFSFAAVNKNTNAVVICA